jgi:3-oxoacyl-[acyl-carrier protein] reductase
MLAFITGGSRGIGRAIVLELAGRGYDIVFCFRAAEAAAAETCELIEAQGGRVIARRCDVTDPTAVSALVREVEATVGRIDVLVNSAAITKDQPLVMMSDENWSSVIATNLTGTFHTCRAVSFSMIKQRRGCIVNLSSVAGVHGNAGQSNYAASKAGLIGLSRSLAKELGPYGVRVNAIAPGLIETDMIAGLGEKRLRDYTQAIPLRRLGAAAEVARLVGFLVSDDASYIHGQVIGVDGGLVL